MVHLLNAWFRTVFSASGSRWYGIAPNRSPEERHLAKFAPHRPNGTPTRAIFCNRACPFPGQFFICDVYCAETS